MQIYSINSISNYDNNVFYQKRNNQSKNISRPIVISNFSNIVLSFKGNKLLECLPNNIEQWLKEFDIENTTLKQCKIYFQEIAKEYPKLKKQIDALKPSISSTSYILPGHIGDRLRKPYIEQKVILLDKDCIPQGFYNIEYAVDGKIQNFDGYLE